MARTSCPAVSSAVASRLPTNPDAPVTRILTGPRVARVTSADSFIPLGDAALHVLVSERDVERAARELVRGRG